MSKGKLIYSQEQQEEIIKWHHNPWPNSENAYNKTGDEIKKKLVLSEGESCKAAYAKAKKEEREWGNKLIKKTSLKVNPNWTTQVGEGIVHDVLIAKGENPRKCKTKNGFKPDWETDDYIYEVKTRNWTVTGTAGEKVLGTMFKYIDVPKIYGKPLKIICVAYQEWEFTNGHTKLFGDMSDSQKEILEYYKSFGIEYVKFSDLLAKLPTTQSAHQSSSPPDS